MARANPASTAHFLLSIVLVLLIKLMLLYDMQDSYKHHKCVKLIF